MVTFANLRQTNVGRCGEVFHPLEAWSGRRWGLAVFGEIGEAINAAKKLWRGDGKLEELGDELGDVVIYLDLLAARIGYGDLGTLFLDLYPTILELQSSRSAAGVRQAFDLEGACENLAKLSPGVLASLDAGVQASGVAAILVAVADLAVVAGLDLEAAVVCKFDATSRKRGSSRTLQVQAA